MWIGQGIELLQFLFSGAYVFVEECKLPESRHLIYCVYFYALTLKRNMWAGRGNYQFIEIIKSLNQIINK